MKKILVPFDFSEAAVAAFRFALDVAHQSESLIHLTYVIDFPVIPDYLFAPALGYESAFFVDMREGTQARFTEIVKKYNVDRVKVTFSTDQGHLFTKIIQLTNEYHFDTIVMGSHGSSGLSEIFLGSNAERIVRRSTVPVFVVKEYKEGGIRNIVLQVGTKNSEDENFTAKVKALQDLYDATIHIVFVNTPGNFSPDRITKDRLTEWAHRNQFEKYTINIFNAMDEATGVSEFAKQVEGELIAVVNTKRKGLASLIARSLVEEEVNHSDRIIWSYPDL